MKRLRRGVVAALSAAVIFGSPAGAAEPHYGPGVSDTEIVLGNTMAYSGPASAFGTIGRTAQAYFTKLNAEGGIHRRKVRFVSLDDGYSPPKTVELARRLVEQDNVFAMFLDLGTASNAAIHKYLNTKKVPHLFIDSIGSKWNDPANFPWTMAMSFDARFETAIFARYLLKQRPQARVAVLYQDDDFGKGLQAGLVAGLGASAARMIVAESTYLVTDPTIDSQIVSLKASGADTFFCFCSPKFAAQAIRKTYEIGWKAERYVSAATNSIPAVLAPAGLERSAGLVSTVYSKSPGDPQWASDAGMADYLAFMKRYYPEGDPAEPLNAFAYSAAQLMEKVLRLCGDDLTRENLMRKATTLAGVQLPMLLPGMSLDTSPTDCSVISQAQLARFDGKQWVPFGDLVSGR